MKQEDIIRMAREAGMAGMLTDVVTTFDELGRFAALVAAAEREACDMGAACIGCSPRSADGSCPDAKPSGVCDCYQEGFHDGMNEFKELYEEQPVQLVAHREAFWCVDLTCKKCYGADFRFKHKSSVDKKSLTTPARPEERPWVGLTDYEIGVCSTEAAVNRSEMVGGAVTFARAIEAKLKEKNT